MLVAPAGPIPVRIRHPAPDPKAPIPPATILLPDGSCITTDETKAAATLSRILGRDVTIAYGGSESPSLEEYWPDIESLAHRDEVTEELITPNSFFDGAPVHLRTTSTLKALTEKYPSCHFDGRRFRPNIVIDSDVTALAFAENHWIGATLAIGEEVILKIERVTGRCVMTTLAKGELPRDLGILRRAAQHNGANVGVYATVVRGGAILVAEGSRIVPIAVFDSARPPATSTRLDAGRVDGSHWFVGSFPFAC